MPELPEVETIARSLRNAAGFDFSQEQGLNERPGVQGRVIKDAMVDWPRSIALPRLSEFLSRIPDQTVLEVNRRGKFLVFDLDKDWLLIHLRMSGDIRVEPMSAALDQPHDRVVFNFQDGTRMVFNDTRKFGRVWLVNDPDIVLSALGPEPFDEKLTAEMFHSMLQTRGLAIKSLLLDQHFISGLGNIYTDEALHRARVHPLQKANTITYDVAQRLLLAIRQVLTEGIRRNGASIDWVYRGGEFQNHFKVYQRTGQPCLGCGNKIERITVGQRGTHYCPHCQVNPHTNL
jgi:formamidopyrimidine-DNA glycosylase